VNDPRDRIERLSAARGRLTCRHPWRVIGLVLLGVGSLASQLSKLGFDTSKEGFLHGDDPVGTACDAFREMFYFGLLTGFTIIAAFLADQILAPALIALVMRPRGVEMAAALDMEVSR